MTQRSGAGADKQVMSIPTVTSNSPQNMESGAEINAGVVVIDGVPLDGVLQARDEAFSSFESSAEAGDVRQMEHYLSLVRDYEQVGLDIFTESRGGFWTGIKETDLLFIEQKGYMQAAEGALMMGRAYVENGNFESFVEQETLYQTYAAVAGIGDEQGPWDAWLIQCALRFHQNNLNAVEAPIRYGDVRPSLDRVMSDLEAARSWAVSHGVRPDEKRIASIDKLARENLH